MSGKVSPHFKWLFVVALFSIKLASVSIFAAASDEITNLQEIEADKAWEITKGVPEIVVAILDSGIVFNSKLPTSARWENSAELAGEDGIDDDHNGYIDDNYGWDFKDNDSDPSPESSLRYYTHGTSVTSVISAAHDDGQEPLGLAPNVKIMHLRVHGGPLDHPPQLLDRVQKAIEYAIANNAAAISMSILFQVSATSTLLATFAEAGQAGIPIITLAANSRMGFFSSINENWTIGVTAQQDLPVLPSPLPKYYLFASGMDIPAILPDGTAVGADGRCFAAPQVSGTIALMLSARNDLPISYLGPILQHTTMHTTKDYLEQEYEVDQLNVYQAVNAWKNFENVFTVRNGEIVKRDTEESSSLIGGTIFLALIAVGLIALIPKRQRKSLKKCLDQEKSICLND